MGTEERERAAAEVKWYFNVQEERRVQNQQRFRRRRDGSQLLSDLLASEWRNEHELRLYERKKRREREGEGERERERERETTEPLFPSDDDDDGEERVLRESEARFVPARGKRRVVRAFLFAALAGALFGYDIGSTAVVTSEDQILSDFDIPPNSWQQGALVSCSLYGALVASVLLFAFGEVLGRRQEILFANVLYCLGSVGSVLPR